jgi:glycosyltransferase involved in cell wall biosynthesis
LLEALACGRPAIVSAIPGNREWIIPGVQGWLFPDGDDEALAQAILGALDQRDRLIEMGREARTLAEARADWSVNFQNLLHAYQLALHPTKMPQ